MLKVRTNRALQFGILVLGLAAPLASRAQNDPWANVPRGWNFTWKDASGNTHSRHELEKILEAAMKSKAPAHLEGANLTGASLTRMNLSGAILDNAILTDTSLLNANLSGAKLTKATLTNADLKQANLSGAVLRDANLSHANLAPADLIARISPGQTLVTHSWPPRT